MVTASTVTNGSVLVPAALDVEALVLALPLLLGPGPALPVVVALEVEEADVVALDVLVAE